MHRYGDLAAAAEGGYVGSAPQPGKIYHGVALNSWQNKYEIEGLQDNVWLVLSVWKL